MRYQNRFLMLTVCALFFYQNTVLLADDPKRPNILFIAVDDLRPAMGCYGDELAITPNLDRLAGKGLLFDRAYCQVAVCNPSRASLMTGQRPDKLGVWTLPIHFREAQPDAVTIPQWFRKHGYTAVSHGKIFHNPTPDPQSWSEPIRSLPELPFPYPQGTREIIEAAKAKLPGNDWRKKSLQPPSTSVSDLPDDKLVDGARTAMAIDDLKRLSQQDEPFFLAMGYIRPHLEWVAPKKYWDLHERAKLPVNVDEEINPNTPPYAINKNIELSRYVDLVDMPKPWDEETIPVEQMRKLIHGYYACVSYVDAQIGLLLSALEEQGTADNTIIVLWSDHGFKLGEYRGWGKKTNYEVDTRVPLIISTPQMRSGESKVAGQKTESFAELLDLFPTLCELANIGTPDFVDGKSLVPTLNDPAAEIHVGAVSQYYRQHGGQEYMGYAIRTATHRMVEWRDFSTGSVTTVELYDHQDDPSERHNVADSSSKELLDELGQLLLTRHPRRGLVMTPKIHSSDEPNRKSAQLSFRNETAGAISIISILKSGTRSKTKQKRLGYREGHTFDTLVGDVFVIESDDGTIHEIHTSTKPKETIVVGG